MLYYNYTVSLKNGFRHAQCLQQLNIIHYNRCASRSNIYKNPFCSMSSGKLH